MPEGSRRQVFTKPQLSGYSTGTRLTCQHLAVHRQMLRWLLVVPRPAPRARRAAGVQTSSHRSRLAGADGLPGSLAVSGAAVAGGAGYADGLGAGWGQVEGVEVGVGHGAVEAAPRTRWCRSCG